MLLHELFEARKNPELNPKQSINSLIINELNNTSDSIAGTKNLFVSFTEIDKLGINPGSQWGTPIGIYAYPAEYVVKIAGTDLSMRSLPFAGVQPYANVFKATGNIINVATISNSEVDAYYDKLHRYTKSRSVDNEPIERLRSLIADAPQKARMSDYPGGQLWYVIKEMSKYFSDIFDSNPVATWNATFRAIGIDGAVDIINGDGLEIIDTNEPCQAVFFSTKAVRNVKRFINSYSPVAQQKSVAKGQDKEARALAIVAKLRKAKTPEEAYRVLDKNGFDKINLVSDPTTRQFIINKNPGVISYLRNPTKEEQRLALLDDFEMALNYIRKIDQGVIADVFRVAPDKNKVGAILDAFQSKPVDGTRLVELSPTLQLEIVKFSPNLLIEIERPARATVQYVVDNWNRGTIPNWLRTKASGVGIKI